MIKINNIYFMLSYAFKILKNRSYATVTTESFEYAQDLFAAILIKGINSQIKRGIYKEYISENEEIATIKGKIQINETIRKKTLQKRKIICEIDEFSEKIYLNKIIVSVINMLMYSNDVKKDRKNDLKKILRMMSSIETIDLNNIKWNRIKFNRNNASYKMIINICYLAVNNIMLDESKESKNLDGFMDDQKLYDLFERFVLEYYKKHWPRLKPSRQKIKWNILAENIVFLPQMRTDVTLNYNGNKLIIDTKYYTKIIRSDRRFNSEKVSSANLYQIYAYVKNEDVNHTGNVSGLILYAKTDEIIEINEEYRMEKNSIKVKTLDLSRRSKYISEELDDIAKTWIRECDEKKG